MSTSMPWCTLERTLRLRRNLERSLTPIKEIGAAELPKPYESLTEFKSHRKEFHDWLAETDKALLEVNGLRTRKQVKAKIKELKAEEVKLWATCRPDLYPLPEGEQE